MDSIAEALEHLGGELVRLVGDVFSPGVMDRLDDRGLLEVMVAAGRLQRGAEAVLVEATAHAHCRSDAAAHADRMTTRAGCRSMTELVQRATRVSTHAATGVVRAARVVQRPVAPSTGELLPAELPHMRSALAAAHVGVDGLLAVAEPLRACQAGRAAVLAADSELAAAAVGTQSTPPACADELRAQASIWAMYLDQDGAEPREARAMRRRGVTLGVCRDSLVPVRGNLLPEVAAQFEALLDSQLNPKVSPVPVPAGPTFVDAHGADPDEPLESRADDRTRAQKQHDALAAILAVAAASGGLPAIGGAAPTLVVSVRADDVASGRGFAHIGGSDEPVSLAVARQVACSGAVERVVVGMTGRIVSIATLDRVFTHHQRKAIALRDGGCVIPGCHVGAGWCEIHHVVEHARGGPTHTDNGVLLCWFHHRTIDSSGWSVRMRGGVPEVRGPHWWDSRMRWRPATKSPTRMRERMARRT